MAGPQLWQLEEFQPGVMLDFVRRLKPDPQYQGDRYLPSQTIDDVEFEYLKSVNEKPVMAHIIGWDSEAPMAGRPPAGAKLSGELPPIKRKQRMSEREIVRRYNQPRRGTQDQQTAIRGVYNDVARLVQSIQATAEWLQMQAISEDVLTYNESGMIIEFDYGHVDTQQITLGATAGSATNGTGATESGFGPVWSDTANATPISDLMKICQRIQDATGERPARAAAPQEVIDLLSTNEQIKGWTYATNAPDRPLTDEEIALTFRRYRLPELVPYDVQISRENPDGSTEQVRPLRSGRIVLLPERNVGRMLWGPTAEAQVNLAGSQYAQQAPGIWANTYYMDEPPSQWAKACAVAFPALPNVDKIGQLDVLA